MLRPVRDIFARLVHSRRGVPWRQHPCEFSPCPCIGKSVRPISGGQARKNHYSFGTCAAIYALVLGVVLAGTNGCGRKEQQPVAGSAPALLRTATEGPVRLTLSITPDAPALEQIATVRVEAVAASGTTLEPGDYERRLRETVCRFDCRVVQARREKPIPTTDGNLAWRQHIELEFLVAGEVELPEATATFTSVPAETVGTPHSATLSTERLPVTVRAAATQVSEEQLKEIKVLDPVELPWKWPRWLWLGPLILAGAALGLWLLIFLGGVLFPPLRRLWPWLRGRLFPTSPIRPTPPMPADEWALQALARLVAEDLLARGQIQEFHYRISDIVRGYIERRFGLSAPEMTTEEFLLAATQDRRLGTAWTKQLDEFLAACDMVKYARQSPGPGEAEALVETAQLFVEHTRVRSAVDEAAGMSALQPAEEVRA